jgi:recombination protein RecA
MSTKMEELKKLTTKLNAQAKRAGREDPVAFIAAGNEKLLDFGLLATGNPAIDEALEGGIRRGIFAMVWGKEGTGKTRMCFDWVAYLQKKDPEFIAMWVHLEDRAFPLQAAIEAGCDLDRLLIIPIQSCGEKTFDMMMKYLWDWEKSQPLNLVDVVVVDSVAALLPNAELDSIQKNGMEGITVGRQAAMMSKAFRTLAGTGALGKTTMLLINQVRKSIDSYGSPDTMPGGKAMAYYVKTIIRIDHNSSGLLKKGTGKDEVVYGHTINGKIPKNNAGPGKPHARFNYDVHYGIGVDTIGPLIDAAINKGIIEQPSTAWFVLPDGERVNGRSKIEARIRDDETLHQAITLAVEQAAVQAAIINAPENEGSLEQLELPEVELEKEEEHGDEEQPANSDYL